jgi:hypothetical protein
MNTKLHSEYFAHILDTFGVERPYELKHELRELEKMSEADACKIYNVDRKDEARECIIDWYKMMQS